jgi:hypothetical protein
MFTLFEVYLLQQRKYLAGYIINAFAYQSNQHRLNEDWCQRAAPMIRVDVSKVRIRIF